MAYSNESDLWLTDKEITNSVKNLYLHLIGNLKTYIGCALANSNYTRNRPEELTYKNISKKRLLIQIDEVILVINQALDTSIITELEYVYPILVFNKKTTKAYMLPYLMANLNYNFSHINYHRRLYSY